MNQKGAAPMKRTVASFFVVMQLFLPSLSFGYQSQADSALQWLALQQRANGSWGDSGHTAALSTSAVLAAHLGKDPDAQAALSDIFDADLRAVINRHIGHNDADALSVGQMD
jgi:hypothetical protein